MKLLKTLPASNPVQALGMAMGLSLACAAHAVTVISYPDFSNLTGLQLNGSAANPINNPVTTADGQVLRLTDRLNQSGSAFSQSSITLQNQNSFSTAFSFRISNPMGISDLDGQGADGIVFVVQTVANNVGGAGGGIGYQNIPNSVGIEFDTWNNGGWDDNDGNHLGVDLSGNIDSAIQTSITPRMNDGNLWYAWVDYNGATDTLEARLSTTPARPSSATLAYNVDLQTVLGSPNAFVGFTSGTGSAGGYHDIVKWEFRDTYDPAGTGVPDGGAGTGMMLLGVAGFLGLSVRSKRS